MDMRINHRALYFMVLTLLLESVHCCEFGSDPDCPRLAMDVAKDDAGNLDWILRKITSMVKSNYFDNIFYISEIDLGIYMFNTSDNTHSQIRHSAELKSIDQLIQVNESVMLAVDESANLVVLISLDNTSSDTTLLCKEDNCCLNSSPCFRSPNLQLGKVAVNPENPYNLFFVDGNRIHQLELNATTQLYAPLPLRHIKDQNVLQLTLTEDSNTLSAVTQVNGAASALKYYTIDLTAGLEADETQMIATPSPNDLKIILQLGHDTLITLGDSVMEMTLIDMVLNTTQNLCTVQDSNSILINSQDNNCQALDSIHFITADKDFIYAVKGKVKRRFFVIRYIVLGIGSSPQPKKSETVNGEATGLTDNVLGIRSSPQPKKSETVNGEATGLTDNESNWVKTAIIILSTALSLLIIGIVCYSVLVRVRKHHQQSKRQTLDKQQDPSPDIPDIELMEIGSSSSHHQPVNVEVASVQQSTNATSSPDAVHEYSRGRPLPPLPSSLVRETDADIENYENQLSHVNPINQIPPAPPPCPGPSTSHKRTLAPSVPLPHIKEHSKHYDSSAHYCDKPHHAEDNPRPRTISPNTVLDPTILQEALSAIQSTSNQRVSSLTLTNNEVRLNFTPQYVPTPDHEYLTINDS